MKVRRLFLLLAVMALIAVACGSDDNEDEPAAEAEPTSVPAEEPTAVPAEEPTAVPAPGGGMVDEGRSLDAPVATISVDGDDGDWASVDGVDMTLEAISDEDFPSVEATLKVAHDGENVFVLMQVVDDYDWDPEDAHLSASAAVQWAVDTGAAEHMGAEDDDRETSLGMVDIWHWELGCAAGEDNGGAVSGPGADHDPGNDDACNFDDEWSTIPAEREDDNSDTGENSLLGVWTHSDPTANAAGTWTFEMSRPLQTGDSQDAQFEAGTPARVALAYWDADTGPDGWEDQFHVQSANQGWIEINFS
jgi:hypothetical protein